MACALPPVRKGKVICEGPPKGDPKQPSKDSLITKETISHKDIDIYAASSPIVPLRAAEDVLIKPQISAPSYLHSLRENEAPPFIKPGPEPRPKLLIGTIMSEEEAIEMIAVAESNESGLRKFLGSFLVKKEIILNYNLTEKNFLISFLTETVDYASQRDFNAFKLATLITVYLKTHLYFKWFYWQAPAGVWKYFKEIMIRHTIEDSPDGQEVFEPEECYDIVSHFHTLYLSHLPLVHLLTFGAYRLKILWPFKAK